MKRERENGRAGERTLQISNPKTQIPKLKFERLFSRSLFILHPSSFILDYEAWEISDRRMAIFGDD
jgi:hypothetical protein